MRRGIILAGGAGTRLHPLTSWTSKQLLPVYDKPMIYYPLCTLMLAGIREILIITTPHHQPSFQALLGDGEAWGLQLSYAAQPSPGGLAQAYQIGARFVGENPSALVLGDNIFHGPGFSALLRKTAKRSYGATIFACRVANPSRYGVVDLDQMGRASSLEEKPSNPRSNLAVTGLYFFDGRVPAFTAGLQPSMRGELEITDLLRCYLDEQALEVEVFGRGFAWLDMGEPGALMDAASYCRTIEERQGLKICSPEEVAWRMGYITDEKLERLADGLRGSNYGTYLGAILAAGQ